ncbi:hypothetical protein [Alkalihalobacterium alkalinitrilicum]|uniref:hypothetical protein n=1 Tax=Alkalihalobacterium alkalinitrilicum TaxID=427920 RepID=UPI000995719A|nr:hypothetical protein [Alkalihalobacterium alkalinitrilicum]
MDRVLQLLDGSISELNKLENELKNLNEEELGQVAASYPFNDYFHEVVLKLKKWKLEIENH